ncbi:hypothetical protein MATL_G00257920 [Megalops atlanticus]|uniref:CxC3 like cysteine cluster domain-containing protein n=1 Tax=Megalops atlanticus TaxID=7932 RepID=A0A9D3PAD9_MEGAT|nr:hypothetical protein MATL_G00257920 [Megalops atlanticus]
MAGYTNKNISEAALLLRDSFIESTPAPAARPRQRQRKRNSEGRPLTSDHQEAEVLIPPAVEHWDNTRSSAADALLQELQAAEVQVPEPPTASNDWATRSIMAAERWKEARPQLLLSALASEAIQNLYCGRCHVKKAVVECKECLPSSFLCEDCDCGVHSLMALHNRRSMISGFYVPLPPTVVVHVKDGDYCHDSQARILPMRVPQNICDCSPSAISLGPGREILFVNMNGRYDLTLPEVSCSKCSAH